MRYCWVKRDNYEGLVDIDEILLSKESLLDREIIKRDW